MARRRERPTPCSPDDTLSWVESRTGQGEEGTSEPGSNDLDGGGDDNSDGQDEEESGSERKQTLKKQQYRKRKRRQSGDGDSDLSCGILEVEIRPGYNYNSKTFITSEL